MQQKRAVTVPQSGKMTLHTTLEYINIEAYSFKKYTAISVAFHADKHC